jgi:hypothetical protein
MANYAIALSFIKANTTVVRAVGMKPPQRYFALRNPVSGFVVPPTLAAGDSYIQMEGITSCNFQVNDTNQDFRLLGDRGWVDSVITGSSVQASCTGFFLKEIVPGNPPTFKPDYNPGFALIQRARYDKDFEVYFEFLKQLGNNEAGQTVYDFTGFNAVVMNYSENQQAEGLLEVSFDLMSRDLAVFGKYVESTGGIVTATIENPGSGYKPGEYLKVPTFTGDSRASGASLDVTVDATGVVSAVKPNEPGSGYQVNDIVSVDRSFIGGGEGVDVRLLVSEVTKGVNPKARVQSGGSFYSEAD